MTLAVGALEDPVDEDGQAAEERNRPVIVMGFGGRARSQAWTSRARTDANTSLGYILSHRLSPSLPLLYSSFLVVGADYCLSSL